ncbi:MAG: OmpA family protein [Fibromonadaceae bacterium]|jgi:outer membrane protein OmpA-like peptidoglycan-associated protein|nr:OmpA family protein [Fibromonadaceae bacterium]
MKLQVLAILACAASLFAQTAPVITEQVPCRASFNSVKSTYPRDAATDRMYALVEARIRALEAVPTEDRKGQYATELKSCDMAIELFNLQLEKVALQKGLDSMNLKNIATQKQLSLVKDSLIELWTSDAKWAKSLNSALSEEHNRLERLSQDQQKTIDEKQRALAEKDSLLAAQKAEASRKLDALNSKAISVYKDARGTILSMSDILFETGKADLKSELKENLAEISAILKSLLTESNIVIEGHTDNVGGAETNQKLSENRASAVLNYLVERGVEKARLKFVGYGLTKPVADNNTKEGQAKNRRVELVIKD